LCVSDDRDQFRVPLLLGLILEYVLRLLTTLHRPHLFDETNIHTSQSYVNTVWRELRKISACVQSATHFLWRKLRRSAIPGDEALLRHGPADLI